MTTADLMDEVDYLSDLIASVTCAATPSERCAEEERLYRQWKKLQLGSAWPKRLPLKKRERAERICLRAVEMLNDPPSN